MCSLVPTDIILPAFSGKIDCKEDSTSWRVCMCPGVFREISRPKPPWFLPDRVSRRRQKWVETCTLILEEQGGD